ncbi:MAG: YceI family protein [Chloroflexi bacterium]|nr:YceI family protein [Chloroflexota bacterium]
MLSQLMSLSPRRLVATGLIVAGVLVGVLLIILWQVGLFDSAPPPVSLQSAVESVRQDEEQQAQAQPAQTQQDDSQSQATAQAAQDRPEPAQQQQDSDSTEDSQEQSAESTDAQDEAESGSAQSAQQQSAESTQSQQTSAQQQDAQATSEQQDGQQAAQQAQATQQETSQTQTSSEPPMLAELAGTWTLSGQGTSFVGYRIGEELANIGTTTAVGRTSDIEATLEFDGVMITSVTIVADLRTLTSDQSFRDGALRTRGIESDTYPFATFVLVQPIPIATLPAGEETLSVTVDGTLDLHGVTNPVSIDLQGQFVDSLVVVVGSTEIALADYDIEPPTGFRVLSIDDVGIMEFQIVLERAP